MRKSTFSVSILIPVLLAASACATAPSEQPRDLASIMGAGGPPDRTFYKCSNKAENISFEGGFADNKGKFFTPSGAEVDLTCGGQLPVEVVRKIPVGMKILRSCEGTLPASGKVVFVGLSNSMGNVQAHAVTSQMATMNCVASQRPRSGGSAFE